VIYNIYCLDRCGLATRFRWWRRTIAGGGWRKINEKE